MSDDTTTNDFDLSEALGASFDEITSRDATGGASPAAPAPVGGAEAPTGAGAPETPARDKHGRFTSTGQPEETTQRDTLPEGDAPGADAADETTTQDETGSQTEPRVPAGWKPDEVEMFRNLDPAVQDVVLRREGELQGMVTRKVQEVGRLGEVGTRLHQEVFGPRAGWLQSQGIDPIAQTAVLWGHLDTIIRDPEAGLLQLLQQFNVPLERLAQRAGVSLAASEAGDPANPAPSSTDHPDPSADRLQALELQIQQQQINAHASEIDTFRAAVDAEGKPLRPHFSEVFDDMLASVAALRQQYPQAPVQHVLDKAYNMAVAANPEISARAAAARAARDAAIRDRKAREARGGRNVFTTGATTGGGTAPSKGANMRDTLAMAHDRAAEAG